MRTAANNATVRAASSFAVMTAMSRRPVRTLFWMRISVLSTWTLPASISKMGMPNWRTDFRLAACGFSRKCSITAIHGIATRNHGFISRL